MLRMRGMSLVEMVIIVIISVALAGSLRAFSVLTGDLLTFLFRPALPIWLSFTLMKYCRVAMTRPRGRMVFPLHWGVSDY